MAAEIIQDDTLFVSNFIKSVTEGKILQSLSNTSLHHPSFCSENTKYNRANLTLEINTMLMLNICGVCERPGIK
jgi:hypothetical protein